MNPELVTNGAALHDVCTRLVAAGRFAFDTEFVTEDSYRAQICLVQAATDSFCALLDPLAGADLRPFWELVADPQVETIVHSGSEDVGLCVQEIGRPAARVFDVQVAAGFVGWGYPMNLGRLVRRACHARLHKSETLSDWRRRPLTADQIAYAVEDVSYLPAAHAQLTQQLDRLGRRGWFDEEMAALRMRVVPADGQRGRIRRPSGARSLTGRGLAIADALLDERDKLARELDRPVRGVLKDHLLIELAKRGWTDIARMRTLRGLSVSNAGLRRLAAAIEQAKQVPEHELPAIATVEENPELDALAALSEAILRDYCLHHELSFALLTGKRDIESFVTSRLDRSSPTAPENESSLARGWRYQVVGRMLEHVLLGESSIQVERRGHRLGLVIR